MRRFTMFVAPLLALALLAAGCGDDSSTDESSTTEPAATGGAGLGGTTAEARVAAFREEVTELPISDPVEVPSGAKNVYYVQCSVPVCATIGKGIEAAAKALGWTFTSTTHQDTPDTVGAAFDAAVAAKPDVVLTSGNPREWFATQLDALEKAGTPVISWSIPEGYEPGKGISVNLLTNDDYYFYGVLMADYVAVNSKTKNVLFVGLPIFPVLATLQQGFNDEIAKVCPDCKVETLEAQVTDIGGALPGQVVSKLQANKEIDFVAYAYAGTELGVPEALASAGLEQQAKGITQAGDPPNFAYVEEGKHQVAEIAIASELLGWRAMDAAARVLTGKSVGRAKAPAEATIDGHPDILAGGLPLQILEKGDIADPSSAWPGVKGFEDKFKKLWGI